MLQKEKAKKIILDYKCFFLSSPIICHKEHLFSFILFYAHPCIEHLVAEATVKLLWVGLWTSKQQQNRKKNVFKLGLTC